MKMKRPNIFKYATSELSQDAFLCWFIAWADKEQSKNDLFLHTTACCFVKELLEVSEDYEIKTVKVGRQWNNIDVWALVNDKYFIVIEDKKGTSEHSDQLKRYAEIARKKYEKSDIEVKLVYFKMEEQGKYKNIEKAGFSIFTREKMLSILTKCIEKEKVANVINHILNDYYATLNS